MAAQNIDCYCPKKTQISAASKLSVNFLFFNSNFTRPRSLISDFSVAGGWCILGPGQSSRARGSLASPGQLWPGGPGPGGSQSIWKQHPGPGPGSLLSLASLCTRVPCLQQTSKQLVKSYINIFLKTFPPVLCIHADWWCHIQGLNFREICSVYLAWEGVAVLLLWTYWQQSALTPHYSQLSNVCSTQLVKPHVMLGCGVSRCCL